MTEGAETHRVELTVERPGIDARRVEVTAPGDTTAGDVLDGLAFYLGLTGANGAAFGQSLLSNGWVDRDLPVGRSGLLRGEHLSVTVGLDTPQASAALRRWSTDAPMPDANGCVPVNRPPRQLAPPYASQIRVPAPPAPPEARRFPTGALFLPLILGLVLVIITRRPEVALFALFSPMMVGWNAYEDRRTNRESFGRAGTEHGQAIEQAVADATAAAHAWFAGVTDSYPSPAETMERARDLSPRIWERRPGDPDFLDFRLGLSNLYAPIDLVDDPAPKGVEIGDAHARVEDAITMDGAPVHASLRDAGVVSIVGPHESLDDLVRWILCQLCLHHSPRDLTVAGVLSDALAGEWITWLPHRADQLLEMPAVIFGDGRALDLVARLQAWVDARADEVGRSGASAAQLSPSVVVVIDARTGLDPALYAQLIESGSRANVGTIWIGDDERLIPGNSTTVIRVGAPNAEGALEDRANGTRFRFDFEGMTSGEADFVGLALAPLVDTTRQVRGAGVPNRVRYDELEPDVMSPAARRRAWEDDSDEALWALLGVSASGPFEIDLGQSGSHVLVAGTTGSGKSELLQTLVASLAVRYSPARVTFLLVDYKGGSAFKDAGELPHIVGLLTDLDEHLTRRVLLSLNAEIIRREQLLKDAGASSLGQLRRSNPEAAPPALIIVADEFAALAKEIPEFMPGVVDIAARGRTLGLRVVLATQRPAGIITPQILANVSLRIALRMLDEPDSASVIDSRDAAHIPSATPGRALARADNNLLEFQTAFVGAPAESVATDVVTIRDLDQSVAAKMMRGGSARPDPSAPTVLHGMVDATNKVMQLGRWPKSFAPWLPPLPPVITLGDLVEDLDGAVLPSSAVLIGRTDQPERQHQGLLALDFDRHGHLLVYGTARSGKTTLLRTIAAGLVTEHAPSAVNIYALDFGGQGLRGLEGAPHVGGVVGGEDPGRVARLFRRLGRTVDDRERLLAEHGDTNYAELVANQHVDRMPRIVVLLDSYAALVAVIERLDGGRWLDELARLIRSGAKVGVHFVITADRRGAIPESLTTNITTRIVLRMGSREDYGLLGVEDSLVQGARLTPGRGFVQGTIETQLAVMSGEVSGQGQLERFAKLASRAIEQWPGDRAPELGAMPVSVARDQIDGGGESEVVSLGVGDDDLQVWPFELEHNHFLIAGPSRSGRSTALSTIASGLRAMARPPRLYFLGTRRSPASNLGLWDVVVPNIGDQAATDAALAQCDADLQAGLRVVLVCDDIDELPDPVSNQLEALARRGRDEPLRIVAAAENRSALRTYSGLIPELRKAKHGLLLAPDIDLDGDLLGVRLRPPIESLTVTGRGFAVRDGYAELIQVAH